jgi:hypothetical protein
MKKYIKGKDGKFKGSIPSPASIPSTPTSKLPPVPADSASSIPKSANFYPDISDALAELKAADYPFRSMDRAPRRKPWEDVDLTIKSGESEDGGTEYYFTNFESEHGNEAILGNIDISDDGGYVARYEIDLDGDLEEAGSETFSSKSEAEAWLQESMKRSADYIINFDNTWRLYPGDIDREIKMHGCDEDFWHESGVRSQPKNGYGERSAYMRGSTPNRSVEIVGTEVTGYSVLIREHEDDNDDVGKSFMIKHANSFEEAIAFGRYVGTGAADYKRKSSN